MIGKTVRYLFAIVVFSLFLFTAALAGDAVAGPGDIAGTYAVTGWNPGGDMAGLPQYQGSVELTAWGEGWKYRGVMDGIPHVGAGVFDEATGVLSLSFRSVDGSESGATMLRATEDGFSGRWVYAGKGNGALGAETWTRRP